ncbi:MAG: hypothetical protein EOO22_16230, partial [Comamonadaceae bacterium]
IRSTPCLCWWAPAGRSSREAALASGHVTGEQFDAWVIPENMTGR